MDNNKPKEPITLFNIFGLIYPLGIYYVAQVIVVILFAFYVVANNPEAASDKELYTELVMKQAITITLVSDAILIPIMILLMKFDSSKLKKKGYKRVLQNVEPAKFLLVIPYAFLGMVVCNLLATFALSVLPESFTKSYDSAAASIYSGNKVVMVIAVALVGPILEELVFRGVLYNRLKDMFGVVVAVLGSAITFGVFHMNWVQGIYAGTLGLLLAFLYYKYKSIIAPIMMHVTCNSISLVATFLSKEGVEGAAKGSEKAEVTPELLSGFMFYLFIFIIMFFVILTKVRVVEQYVRVDNNNPYGKYGELNNPYGYNQMNNGYNQMNNGYNQMNNGYNQMNNGYNQMNNGYNQPNNVPGQTVDNYNGYGNNQWIDDYLSNQGNSNNNDNNINQ